MLLFTSAKEDAFLSVLFYCDVGPHSARYNLESIVGINVLFAKMEQILTKYSPGLESRNMTLEENLSLVYLTEHPEFTPVQLSHSVLYKKKKCFRSDVKSSWVVC